MSEGVSRHEPESVRPVRAVAAAPDRGWFVGTGGYTLTYREWREGMVAALFDWLWEIWAKRDPLYISDEELEESRRRLQAERERESKRRADLEGNPKFMGMLRRVAQGTFGAPKDMSLLMVSPSIRAFQLPILDEGCVPYAWTEKYTPEHELPTFHTENIELERLPSWFRGKFYDLYVGYGPESKAVVWRVGDHQW